MQPLLQKLKGSLGQSLKYSRLLWLGYPLHYANQQAPGARTQFCHLWSRCITPVKQRSGAANTNENRLWNMQLAAKGIDGLILQPNQIFSFWHRVPRPTPANEFRPGPMLIRGQLTTDIGGGLCQVSTTLFGAFLQANLQILERHHHSIDAHGSDRFFRLGQDAAVVYGYKDLIVRNLTQIPLQIDLEVLAEQMIVSASIWGAEPIPVHVNVDSRLIKELPVEYSLGVAGQQVETKRSINPACNQPESVIWQINYCTNDIYQPYTQA